MGAGSVAEQPSVLTEDQRAQFEELIARAGFDPEQLTFVGNTAVVDHDIAFDVPMTLATGGDPHNKGHYRTPSLSPKYIGRLLVTPSKVAGETLSAEWTRAFEVAVQRWQEAYPWKRFKISWVQLDPAKATAAQKETLIVLRMGTVPANAPAMSSWPSADGQPGKLITVNRSYNTRNGDPSCKVLGELDVESLSFEQKVKTAIHEIGHAFGFEHPRPAAKAIPGTQVATSDDAGNTVPSYPSVMWAGCIGGYIVTSPSADDIASVRFLEDGGT